MARKQQWREPEGPLTRKFTPDELKQIQALTAATPSREDGHPRSQIVGLNRIWKATGRQRPFMLWELDDAHDAAAAFEEEVNPKPPEFWLAEHQISN